MSLPERPVDDRPRPHRLDEFPAGYSLGRSRHAGQKRPRRPLPQSRLVGSRAGGIFEEKAFAVQSNSSERRTVS